MTWDTASVVTVAGIIIGLFSALGGIVWSMLTGRIEDMKKRLDQVEQAALDTERRLEAKREETAKRFGDRLDTLRENVSDVDRTVTGFGGRFVTRQECSQMHGGRRGG